MDELTQQPPQHLLDELEGAVCKVLSSVPPSQRWELARQLSYEILLLQHCANEAQFLRMAGESVEPAVAKYFG